MNSIEYFRNLSLLEFGYPLDGKVLELYNYINSILKGLRCFSTDDGLTYYHKHEENSIFIFNKSSKEIKLHHIIYYKFYDYFDLSDEDITEIVHKRIREKFRL